MRDVGAFGPEVNEAALSGRRAPGLRFARERRRLPLREWRRSRYSSVPSQQDRACMSLAASKPHPAPTRAFKRVLLKISGEALMGEGQYGIDQSVCERIAQEVVAAVKGGTEMCLVIGGGNIFRGMQGAAKGMERASADYMGMLATVMNALAMQNAIEAIGGYARVLSAIPMVTVCEPYIRRRAMRHMEKGRIVIFAAGTGNPFFTTDTAAALRAAEMGCNALFKGTQVDGVYSADPKHDASATRYDRLSYHEVLARDLKVMDASAISLMRENGIPIVVFSINTRGGLAEVLAGRGICTVITD
jgi:uridylate kinase